MSKNTVMLSKPLKGSSLDLSSANIGDLSSSNLKISPANLQSLMSGTNLNNVIITNSEIDTTIIGSNGPSDAFFEKLSSLGDVFFYSTDKTQDVNWDSAAGILNVNANMTIEGCMTIGNIIDPSTGIRGHKGIIICKDTISALDTNSGDINITPGFINGSIKLNGPIYNDVSHGNFYTNLNDGNVTFTASDYINMTSQSSGITNSSFNTQKYSTVNGNINLQTDTGFYSNIISSTITNITKNTSGILITTREINNLSQGDQITIYNTNSVPPINNTYLVTSIINSTNFNISTGTSFSGFQTIGSYGILSHNVKPLPKLITNITQNTVGILITTDQPSCLNQGDQIIMSNTNCIPPINNIYLVTGIINSTNFNISTGNTFQFSRDGTSGSLLKTINNSINLGASYSVNIPNNVPLIFGNTIGNFNLDGTTTNPINSITGNLNGIVINSQNDIKFNVPSNIILPQSTHLQFGTSGNNYINFKIDSNNLYDTNIYSSGGSWNTDLSATLNINSNNNIALNAQNDLYVNVPHTYYQDQNPLIANYQQYFNDNTDRGIQFNYWSGNSSGGSSRLGWFGFKKDTRQFTFYENAINNNDIITGTLSAFAIGSINVNNISINSGGTLNAGCGNIINVSSISGCTGLLDILATNVINIKTNKLNIVLNDSMNLPNNIPINMGTSGSFIKEGTFGNLLLTGTKNILLNNQTNGSIVIQPNTKISFDGTSIGNKSIYQSTSGNLNIDSNKNIFLTVTSGNVIIPAGNSNISSSIQFGQITTETIYASTSGMYLSSLSNTGNINLLATSNVNISNTVGNIQLVPLNGDINLFTSKGNVRLFQTSYLVFGITSTSNSIRQNSIGNLMINGPGIIPNAGTVGNTIEIKNASQIYLNANVAVDINTGVQMNFSSNNDRYIIADTLGNFNIINNLVTSNLNLKSNNLNITNTNGNTNINNSNFNITTGNSLNIIAPNTFLNTDYFYIKDQLPLIANYLQIQSDLTDRGIQFNYYNTTKGSADLGWFGVKKNSMQFTYYQSAINTNDQITGTLGTFNLGSINVSNNISFLTTGNIDMTCGTISNLNTIIACKGVLNIMSTSNVSITSQNLLLNTGLVQIPYNTPLSFNNTSNSLIMNSSGTMSINVNSGTGTLVINSNLQVNGTTTNVYSTITNYQDPIISIGGIIGPITSDLKDRGIEFKWFNSTTGSTQIGFFGFKNSTQRFVFYPQDTNNNEIITGSLGNVQFGNGYFNNLDVNCGTISNISLLTGCINTGLTIQSNNLIVSSGNVLMNYNSILSFGNTNESISGTSSGNLIINTPNNINLTSVQGGINLITNTTGTGYVGIQNNTPLYFGDPTSGSYIYQCTRGNLRLVNSTGNIFLTPQTNGQVIMPINDLLVFGNTQTSISSDGTNLQLNGYTVSINSTGPTIFNGTVQVNGTLIASSTAISADTYVYPLGTHNGSSIQNISSSTSAGLVNITTSIPNNAIIGQTIIITGSNVADGNYNVQTILSPNTFTISHGSVITTTNLGNLKTSLNSSSSTGLELDYWQNTTSSNLTYQTGFLGLQAGSNTLVYYSQAIINNNQVTGGTLGNIILNQLNINYISGISGTPLNLASVLNTSTYLVQGSNFEIQGGFIDNVIIGQTIAQPGTFTTLSSKTATSLTAVTLNSTINYSVDRITLSSLQPTANPSLSKIITYVQIQGNNFSGIGTLGNLSLANDGQLKKIVCQSCSSGGSYSLFINNLISCNPLGGPGAKGIKFTRAGMSCELIWNAQGVNSSTGCFEIIGGLAYVF